MSERLAINSRHYIVAFELRSPSDCPPDFEVPTGFDEGLFLPRGDPDWFGRPSYPPRILLLKDGALHIVDHPSTGEPPRRCALEQISSVEAGHLLLKGWLRFTGAGFDYSIRYNTRGLGPVFRFMRRFRDQWLGGARLARTPAIHRGVGLDIKFANAMAEELDPGENIVVQFFQPPVEESYRTWWFPRRHWIAGDLLALTTRRLLWITDRERGTHCRYGSVASYAPLDVVINIGLTSDRAGQILHVDLDGSSAWQVPIAPNSRWGCQRMARDFAAALEPQKRRHEASRTKVRR